jgi:hypothetical protein
LYDIQGKAAMPSQRGITTVSSSPLAEEVPVQHADVSHAILVALADVHPRGIAADTLAALVSCERAALQRPLQLLRDTGAIAGDLREPTITDAAVQMLRHAAGSRLHH